MNDFSGNGVMCGPYGRGYDGHPWNCIWVGSGKANMSPPLRHRDYYEIKGIGLGNFNDAGRQDTVQVVVPFEATEAGDSLSDQDVNKVLDAIEKKDCRVTPQSSDWVGYTIADALGLEMPKGREQVKTYIDCWKRKGFLAIEKAKDAKRRDREFYVVAKRPEQDFDNLDTDDLI